MTKKTVGYVELEWTCPNCGNRNPGPAQKCATCGTAQPEDVQFEQAVEEGLIADEGELAKATAGPDIHCPYCGTRNPAGAEACVFCGGDLTGGSGRAVGRVVGAHRAEAAPPVLCPACGMENPASERTCANCGSVLSKPTLAASATSQGPAPAPARPGRSWVFVLLLIAIVACIGVFAALSLRTDTQVGVVSGVNWSRRVVIEALMPVGRENWLDQVPGDAELGSCRKRLHHTQPDPAPGAVEVCGTPYTVDLGSGYGEVVQDCEYQVFEQWCDYTVLAWREFDSVVIQGQDQAPLWPALSLVDDQREGARREEFSVIFNTEDRELTYRPSSLEDFQRFSPGSRWQLEVNSLGALVSVEPAR